MRLLLVAAVFLLLGCTEHRQGRYVDEAEKRLQQNQFTNAAELFQRAVALNPETKTGIKALYKLGFTQETYLKDYESAVGNYEKFIKLSRDKVSVYEVQKRIANLQFDHGKEPEKAIAAYVKLIQMNPQSLEIDQFRFRIALSHFRLNNFEQARHELQQELLEAFPKTALAARARFEIGNSYYMEGRYDVAVEALKQVIRLHSQSEQATEAQFLMAQCLEHAGRLPAALSVYETIKSRYSAPQIVSYRIAELKKRLAREK